MRNNTLLFFRLIIITTAFLHIPVASAYDNVTVHRAINERASNSPVFNEYLKTNLGYAEGIDKRFLNTRIVDWLGEGGYQEDKPVTRVLQHFHDPVYSASEWDKAGFSMFPSALVWAQKSDHSWATARTTFYDALTTGSEEKFANTFQSLGQVMHLVSDMAVPAHVRADSHFSYLPWSRDVYEYYTKEHNDIVKSMAPYPVNQAIFARAKASAFAAIPISALWDQDVCNNSSDPAQVNCDPDALQAAGLAEFTNANFLSRDTFDDYTYPAFGTLLEVENKWHDRAPVVAEDKKTDYPAYVERVLPGAPRYKLASMNYFAMELDGGTLTGYNKTLDDEVNKDYANILIPRAIGYSTALLDYFFRGDIDLKPGSGGGYSLVNNTSENMSGTFAVYYNDTYGTRRKLVEWASSTVPANGRTQVGNIAIPADHAVPAKYFLVFKGTMGREAGAVAGRVVSQKPSKEYLLVIMSTSFPYSPTTKVETPDIVTLWDMETNSYAQITDTNGDQVSFPITYQELNSRTSNLSDYQEANSEQLLSVGYSSGGKMPDCPLTYQSDRYCTKYNYQNCSRMCSTPNYTGSGNCTTSSPSLGDFNTISISESGNYKFETFGCGDTYETVSQEYTSGENIFVNSTSNNTTLSLPWFSNTPLFPPSHVISVVNNDSGAAIKYLNNTLTLNNTEIYHHESAREYGENCNQASWHKTTREVSINATVNSDFFKWTSTMPSRYTQIGIGNDNQWDYNQCSDMTYWSPLPETHSHFDIALTSLAYDVSGTGLQSTSNNQNQFQIGIVHSSLREISVGLARDLSGDTYNPATYGPIKTYTKVFYSKWPKEISDTGSQARNVNPWSHPWNDSLEGAIEGMTRYFAQNYGEEPAQLRPEFFDKFIFDGWRNPITIAQQNLWKRKFDIKYLTSK